MPLNQSERPPHLQLSGATAYLNTLSHSPAFEPPRKLAERPLTKAYFNNEVEEYVGGL